MNIQNFLLYSGGFQKLFMQYDFQNLSNLLFFTVIVAGITAVAIWRRRSTRGVLWLFYLEISTAVWTFGIALESAAMTIPLKFFWSKIAYLGTTTVGPFFLLFAYEYSQQPRLSNQKILLTLLIIPILTNLLAFTNEFHNLIWTGLTISPVSNLGIYEHGVFFWLFVIGYSYLTFLVGFVILIRSFYQINAIYRMQYLLVILAALIPFIGNVISLVGLSPIEGLDLSPPAFAISGILVSWSLLRFNLFKLVPIARSQIFDNIRDGLLILDAENRIVDANPSIQKIINQKLSSLIGVSIADLAHRIPELAHIQGREQETVDEVPLNFDNEARYFEIRANLLDPEVSGYSGKSIIFHDITRRKQAEVEREKLIVDLQKAMAEVKTLHGLLPICAHCKKIRDDQGYWQNVEEYVKQHTEAEFSHGICPDCIAKLYPELHERMQKKKKATPGSTK
jgi:PAS domain S-box-containing protein